MSDLKSKVFEDIKKTGFIAELKAGSILRKNKWSTSHSGTYEDLDGNKSREIDIVSTISKTFEDTDLHIEFSLVIDVKRMMKRPWVVFSIDKKRKFAQGWRILTSGDNNVQIDKNGRRSGLFPGLIDTGNFKKDLDSYGIAFHESFKTPQESSKIFESLISVSKAAWHYNQKYDSRDKSKGYNKNDSTEIYIYIPVVVLEGNLFQAKLDGHGEVQLEEKELIQVHLNYSSPNYGKTDQNFFPDKVKMEHLEEYLKKSENWFEEMTESFNKRIKVHKSST